MTRHVELLCLANSNKHGNRCIAGLDSDTGDWIRPVSRSGDGGLSPHQYLTRNRHDPRPLDTIVFTLIRSDPDPHQPENWIIGDNSPKFRGDDIDDNKTQMLMDNIHSKSHLFGDTNRKIKYSKIEKSQINSSLELVRPESPQIKIRERDNKEDQPRAVFELQGTKYDLPITDPVWKEKILSEDVLSGMDLEFEPTSAYMEEDKRPLFTISLSSPYNDTCYKLVAAIIPVPDAFIKYIDAN